MEKMSDKMERLQKVLEDRQANLVKMLDWKADKDDIETSEKRMKNLI